MNAVHLRPRHRLHLLQGADELFAAVVHAIDRSHTEVRLETYIYAFDRQGEALALALERAALRGVAVYVVVDGIGTPAPPMQWLSRLSAAGVQWHRFSPLGYFDVFFSGALAPLAPQIVCRGRPCGLLRRHQCH